VPQRTAHEAAVFVSLEPDKDLPMRYVLALYDGRGVAGAEMKISGLLTSKVAMATTSVNTDTTYYCWPISIAVGPAGDAVADVPCLDNSEAPAHV
jgi:hypothetical protein